jgi:hypothetical protein
LSQQSILPKSAAVQIHERLRRWLSSASIFEEERLRNPSVFCDDLYSMFENMQSVLESHLYVTKSDGGCLDARDALAGAS